jgi:predicted kinase
MSPGIADPPKSVILLTGPSHAGKTTLARQIETTYQGVSAVVSLDSFLPHIEYPDEQVVRAAYDKMFRQIAGSNEQVLIIEATFTLVDKTQTCIVFDDLYGELLRLARAVGRIVVGSFVTVSLEEAVTRAVHSRRLPTNLVACIWRCSQVLRCGKRKLVTIAGNDLTSALRALIGELQDRHPGASSNQAAKYRPHHPAPTDRSRTKIPKKRGNSN